MYGPMNLTGFPSKKKDVWEQLTENHGIPT